MIITNGSEAHLNIHIHRLEGDKMYIEGDFLTLYVLYCTYTCTCTVCTHDVCRHDVCTHDVYIHDVCARLT